LLQLVDGLLVLLVRLLVLFVQLFKLADPLVLLADPLVLIGDRAFQRIEILIADHRRCARSQGHTQHASRRRRA
jgi:hypothetical protein